MSGNDERQILEVNREAFVRSCPECEETNGYRLLSRGWEKRMAYIRWSSGDSRPYISRRDWRCTFNSIANLKMKCINCKSFISGPTKKRIINLMRKKIWPREYEAAVRDGTL